MGVGWASFSHGGGLGISDDQGMKTQPLVASVDYLLDSVSNHRGNRSPRDTIKELLQWVTWGGRIYSDCAILCAGVTI